MDPDVEIMFVTEVGHLIPEHSTTVYLSTDFNRHTLTQDEEATVTKIWDDRLKDNARLFNGTKFRVHSVCYKGGGKVMMNLGLTDYRDYLGTNWAPRVRDLQTRGQQELSNPQAFLSDPMGVGAFVVTCDEHVIFLRRSQHCAEAPGMWDIPGGHAEPEEIVGRLPLDQINIKEMSPAAVVHEIFHSIVREVRDEVNIAEDQLSQPLMMGVAKNTTSAGRPSLEFLVRCGLTKDQVLQSYRQGGHAEAEESSDIMMLPVSRVVGLPSKDPQLWQKVAPSAKGCVLLYAMAHGMMDSA